jgi:hypothetical protein
MHSALLKAPATPAALPSTIPHRSPAVSRQVHSPAGRHPVPQHPQLILQPVRHTQQEPAAAAAAAAPRQCQSKQHKPLGSLCHHVITALCGGSGCIGYIE